MSAGLKNGWIRQADVGCFQSQNDPETTPNTVRHNMSASATDIHTQTHKEAGTFQLQTAIGKLQQSRID